MLKKLQIKPQQTCKIFNKPTGLTLDGLKNSRKTVPSVDAIVCFVKSIAELDKWLAVNMSEVSDNTIVWFAYPKKSSPLYVKFKCDINRDKGWEGLKKYKYRPVRAIAIDSDWTALRFRAQHLVKSGKNPQV